MTPIPYLDSANRLYQYLRDTHWNGHALVGPDPIGRVHWRITRFVRSYLPWLPGDDRYIYLQGQAYWIKSNLSLLAHTGHPAYRDTVWQCADYIAQTQPENGAWRHPPIWGRRGFISTVEGVWASLGLLAAYGVLGNPAWLEAAIKWYKFQVNGVGFQAVADGLAANYYAHSTSKIPNVSTMLIWLTAELHHHTGDDTFLAYTAPLIRFIAHSQFDTGELPYSDTRPHFMCYQYNAFQFLDLAHYYHRTSDPALPPILTKLAAYLATGVTKSGSCRYNCFNTLPEITYWGAALATALRVAHHLKLGDYLALSERAYDHLLQQQRPDGGFDFSSGSYRWLKLHDRRSYPRYLAMILYFLLDRAEAPDA